MAEQDRTPEPPAEGSIWQERRPQYRLRRVEVIVPDLDGKVVIRSLTGADGLRAIKRYTRVRLDLWHKTFEEVEAR